jgi:hypothetical protein
LPLTRQILWTTYRRRFASAVPLSLSGDSTCLQWISEVQHFCTGLPVILVGCKKDLRRDPRVIEELRRINQRPVTPEEVPKRPSFLMIGHSCAVRVWPWLKRSVPETIWSAQRGLARASGKSSSMQLVRPSCPEKRRSTPASASLSNSPMASSPDSYLEICIIPSLFVFSHVILAFPRTALFTVASPSVYSLLNEHSCIMSQFRYLSSIIHPVVFLTSASVPTSIFLIFPMPIRCQRHPRISREYVSLTNTQPTIEEGMERR